MLAPCHALSLSTDSTYHWTPSKTMLQCCAFTFVFFSVLPLSGGFFAVWTVITLEVFAEKRALTPNIWLINMDESPEVASDVSFCFLFFCSQINKSILSTDYLYGRVSAMLRMWMACSCMPPFLVDFRFKKMLNEIYGFNFMNTPMTASRAEHCNDLIFARHQEWSAPPFHE